MTTTIYGDIIDYKGGTVIRPATREDWLRARDLGDPYTGAHLDADGETTVYCDGPEIDPEE